MNTLLQRWQVPWNLCSWSRAYMTCRKIVVHLYIPTIIYTRIVDKNSVTGQSKWMTLKSMSSLLNPCIQLSRWIANCICIGLIKQQYNWHAWWSIICFSKLLQVKADCQQTTKVILATSHSRTRVWSGREVNRGQSLVNRYAWLASLFECPA